MTGWQHDAHLDRARKGPHQGYPGQLDPRLDRPEHHEGLRQGRQCQQPSRDDQPLEARIEVPEVQGRSRSQRNRGIRRQPADDQAHDDHAGQDRPEEHLADVAAPAHQRERQQRTDDRPRMVHGPVKAECLAAARAWHGRGDQRVPRGGAQALAHPVEESQQQDEGPSQGEADGRARQARGAVAGQHQALGTEAAVRQPSGDDLQDARRGLRHALDQADDRRTGAEGRGEEQRQQRGDHLAGRVVGQRHQPEHHHGPGQGRGRVARAHRPGRPVTASVLPPARAGCSGNSSPARTRRHWRPAARRPRGWAAAACRGRARPRTRRSGRRS
jgi:hypothetical protein